MSADTPGDAGRAPTAEDSPLNFPDMPRLELDQLLLQLVDRAGEVMATQGRLRGLLRANQAVIGQLALPVVLRRIAEESRELVGARYAALGVLGAGGGLAEFVHSGMDDATVAEIGDLPQGKGILGAVIDEAAPIRLTHLGADPRSSGFPAGHPPMCSFLGVPIRIRDEVFGNLYLTDSVRGEFSEEDEELARSLAATAAVAIDNARLYRSATVRGEWMAATAAATRDILAGSGREPLQALARRALELADADLTLVSLPVDPARETLRIEYVVASDRARESVRRLRRRSFAVGGSLAGHVFSTAEPLRLSEPRARGGLEPDPVVDEIDAGPTVVVPLVGSAGVEGVLAVLRTTGRTAFGADDLDMIAGFASQAAVALELSDARAERERLTVLDERERIAADLHDHVIQRLFAAGLSVQAVAARLGPDADRLLTVVQDLDDTIAQIRTSIFSLARAPGEDGIRGRILDVVTDATEPLGFRPVLRFSGPAESLVGEDESVVDDVVAVLREALSNVVRHAHAAHVEVDLVVEQGPSGARLEVVVFDDGVGIEPAGRRSGLGNLRRRAERRGGEFALDPADGGGTVLRWTVPLR
jgi:signal transduction histidine kinase